ncbi:uncharacterized protein KY384_001562 [Bacidia gigantensis]|uniref:uncharacterized protein n=1 Tax=Bacidia gigantensis TaxID=2732470 RepID=UPI001D04AAA9|nr:uncharacterized protein KY384_001562 [Bacidia gigantensis]KAG8533821.1 hypothetical protein KY384_001562 [Bacidia gigantensis]
MRKPEISKLVLARLITPKAELRDIDWRRYIDKYIVPEVRLESQRFCGPTEDHEYLYPGLDYAKPAHRLRLIHFHAHRQLFKAFDELRLTESEIYHLCNWVGTKWAKDEFERENNMRIPNTTWEGVHPYQPPPQATVTIVDDLQSLGGVHHLNPHIKQDEEDEDMEDVSEDETYMTEEEPTSGDDSEDELQQSVGLSLNERLRASAEANAAARARGEAVTTDAEWEQWLKELAERGLTPALGLQELRSSVSGPPQVISVDQAQLLGSLGASSISQMTHQQSEQQIAHPNLVSTMSTAELDVPSINLPSTVQGH